MLYSPTSSPFDVADRYMRKLTALGQFNGIILLEDAQGKVFQKAYNMEGVPQDMQVNQESALVIASVSKLFFKQVLIEFEASGTISLDDPVQKYIPQFPHEH
ncbi:MAG: serine hydrolase, partial [Bacteroidota bacterium]